MLREDFDPLHAVFLCVWRVCHERRETTELNAFIALPLSQAIVGCRHCYGDLVCGKFETHPISTRTRKRAASRCMLVVSHLWRAFLEISFIPVLLLEFENLGCDRSCWEVVGVQGRPFRGFRKQTSPVYGMMEDHDVAESFVR